MSQTFPIAAHRSRSFRMSAASIVLALLVITGIYVEELVHYKHTLYGVHEYYVVRTLENHPGCTEIGGNPRELRCPIRGYNSVHLACWTDQCTFADQDALPITPERLTLFRQRTLSEFGKMPKPMKTFDMIPHDDEREPPITAEPAK